MCFLRKVCVPPQGWGRSEHCIWTPRCGFVLCSRGNSQPAQLDKPQLSSAATGTLVSCYKWKLWIDNKLLLGTGMVWSSEHAESLLWGLSCNLDIAKTAPSPRGSPGSTGVCLSFCPQITIRSFSWKRKRHSVHIKTATMEEEIAFH